MSAPNLRKREDLTQYSLGAEVPGGAYDAIRKLCRNIAGYRDSKQLQRVLARELGQIVDFSYLAILLRDENSDTTECEVLKSTSQVPSSDCTTEATTMWWAHQHQQALIVPKLDEETRFPAFTRFLRDAGVRSHCVLPLTTAQHKIGALAFGSEEPNAYSEYDLPLLSLVAAEVALAIESAQRFEALQNAQSELQKRNERLKLVLDVNNSVANNLDLRDLLRALSAHLRSLMQCDSVGVALPDPDTEELRGYAYDFPSTRGFIGEEVRISLQSIPGIAFRTGKPVCASGDEFLRLTTEKNLSRAEGLHTSCCLPLMSHGKTLGTLNLGRFREQPFTADDVEFLTQIANQVAIAIENAIAYGRVTDVSQHLAEEKVYLENEIRGRMPRFEEIVGESAALQRVLHEVETVAPSDSTVLILGETGTGKELIARAIHDRSSRREHPFVKLNCAAIPSGLLESELFGHEKGAFTSAIAQHIGRFELANHGTVFLDEIGEIPLELQPKLLRVLQEREFERLGGTRTLHTDARLIAATNRDLATMVKEQKFRADLFYRLNVFPIQIPPLRERAHDIRLLVRHFVQQLARRMNKRIETISAEAMDALVRYHWPGNIRELRNVIERAVILTEGPELAVPLAELSAAKTEATSTIGQQIEAANSARKMRGVLEDTERQEILRALEETGWVIAGPNGAAARLGMKRSTLQFRMKKLGITRPQS